MKITYVLVALSVLFAVNMEAKKKKYPNGDFYEGQWKKDNPHGVGTKKFADGSVYTGEWVFGVMEGKGTYISDKLNYSGSFKRNKIDGPGKLISKNGPIECLVEGNWVNGDRVSNAVAEIIIKGTSAAKFSGSMVITDYEVIPESGEGSWILTDTPIFKGDGLFSGTWTKGEFTGNVYGNWNTNKEGEFAISVEKDKITNCVINFNDGSNYSGMVTNSSITGEGVYTTPDKHAYKGIWKDGKLEDAKMIYEQAFNTGAEYSVTLKVTSPNLIFSDKFGEIDKINHVLSINNIDDFLTATLPTIEEAAENRYREAEIKRLKENEERRIEEEQRKIFAEECDKKYVGLTYVTNVDLETLGTGGLLDFILQSISQSEISFIPGGRVIINVVRKTAHQGLQERMMVDLSNSGNRVYTLKFKGDRMYIGDTGAYLTMGSGKKVLHYHSSGGESVTLKCKNNPTTSVSASKMVGTYYGKCNLGQGVTIHCKLKLNANKTYVFEISGDIDSYMKLFANEDALYNYDEGTYTVSNNVLIYKSDNGGIGRLPIFQNGAVIFMEHGHMSVALTRK